MTPPLAAAMQVPGHMELSERDREADEHVVSGLRGAKADNTPGLNLPLGKVPSIGRRRHS